MHPLVFPLPTAAHIKCPCAVSDMMSTAVGTPGARVSAVLTTWFPGQGAWGIVDVLLGDVAPSGEGQGGVGDGALMAVI